MSCCTNTLDLGCFDSCSTIELPFTFPTDGNYTFIFEGQFNSKLTIIGVENEIMRVDLNKVLEGSTLTMKIFKPDGTQYVYYTGGEMLPSFDCFIFKTYIANEII